MREISAKCSHPRLLCDTSSPSSGGLNCDCSKCCQCVTEIIHVMCAAHMLGWTLMWRCMMTSDKTSPEYSYSYQNTTIDGDTDSLVIKLRCPRLSSLRWCLKLYSLVLGGLGLLLSFVWVCFHLYVLSQTTTQELRLLRYYFWWFMFMALQQLWGNFDWVMFNGFNWGYQ